MLYVCPTPIGNLGDLTLRVLDVLAAVELVACEDTRHTGRLLAHLGIETRLLSYQEHNERERLGLLLPLLREGRDVALVTDAGMPGISDPGFVLVRACRDEGLPVTVLPGPSSVETALVASGLPSDRFTFVGFLPRERSRLVSFVESAGAGGGSVVAFESPRRLPTTLRLLAQRWPDRETAVCRELTKLHEEVVRGPASQVQAQVGEHVRGEVVLVLAPVADRAAGALGRGAAEEGEGGPADARDVALRATLAALLSAGCPTKEAARVVSALSGLPSRRVYAVALEVKSGPAAS
jgi:16S rRNA (cytidine1402-2'-O)-methyltransferase